jgi:hypothetical protein
MRTTTSLTFVLTCLITTSLSAPTPRTDLTTILGSITNPSAGNLNKFFDNGVGNGIKNGNGNSAGVGNGNDNTINLKERTIVNSILGSITNPSAGTGNIFKGNGKGVRNSSRPRGFTRTNASCPEWGRKRQWKFSRQ